MIWTEQQVSVLKKLILAKYTFRQIGNRLGITKNSVAGKCNRLGILSLSGATNNLSKKLPDILLKSDKMVLVQIKKHTDSLGWGLEISEIIEYTKLRPRVVVHAVKRLMDNGYINKIVSHISDHIFYNNSLVKQIEHT